MLTTDVIIEHNFEAGYARLVEWHKKKALNKGSSYIDLTYQLESLSRSQLVLRPSETVSQW